MIARLLLTVALAAFAVGAASAQHLDKVTFAAKPASNNDVLTALGTTSEYFAWVSGGDPFDNFLNRIGTALNNTESPDDNSLFLACRPPRPTNADYDRLAYVAQAKHCVDQVVDQVTRRVIRTAR